MSIFNNENKNIIHEIKDEITRFIEDNYIYNGKITISDKPNKNGLYEISTNWCVSIRNFNITSLTNNLFEWTSIGGFFECGFCKNLTSLKGAPKEVRLGFSCIECNKLKSLEGAPEYVGGNFDCAYCTDLISLKGASEYVKGNFNCSHCKSLTSLEGAPKIINKDFDCRDCGIKFTEDDVRKVSDVGYDIYV